MFFNLDLLVTQIKKLKNFRQSPFLAHDRAQQLSSDFHQILFHAPD